MSSDFAVPQCGQVITDWRIMVAGSKLETWLKHMAEVGSSGRIGKRRRLQVIGRETVADRQAKQIDRLVDMRPDEMRAENSAAVFLDDRLVAVHRLRHAACRVPVRRLGGLDAHLRSLFTRRPFGEP